jgi:hypothetical protein
MPLCRLVCNLWLQRGTAQSTNPSPLRTEALWYVSTNEMVYKDGLTKKMGKSYAGSAHTPSMT